VPTAPTSTGYVVIDEAKNWAVATIPESSSGLFVGFGIVGRVWSTHIRATNSKKAEVYRAAKSVPERLAAAPQSHRKIQDFA
jgi:hypothetical protein